MTISRLARIAGALAVAMAAVPAAAAPFTATLGLSLGPFGQLLFPGVGSGASTASAVTLAGGTFAGREGKEAIAYQFTQVYASVSGNAAGLFSGEPLAGTLPLFGRVLGKRNDGGGPLTILQVPLFTGHGAGSGAEAVGLGIGGSYRITTRFSILYLKVFHTAWTAGMKTNTGVLQVYSYHRPSGSLASHNQKVTTIGTTMATGSDSRTPGGLGQLTLVSPTKVETTFLGDGPVRLVVLGSLTLSFVPEPATGLLLGCGVAGLALLRRRPGRRS